MDSGLRRPPAGSVLPASAVCITNHNDRHPDPAISPGRAIVLYTMALWKWGSSPGSRDEEGHEMRAVRSPNTRPRRPAAAGRGASGRAPRVTR